MVVSVKSRTTVDQRQTLKTWQRQDHQALRNSNTWAWNPGHVAFRMGVLKEKNKNGGWGVGGSEYCSQRDSLMFTLETSNTWEAEAEHFSKQRLSVWLPHQLDSDATVLKSLNWLWQRVCYKTAATGWRNWAINTRISVGPASHRYSQNSNRRQVRLAKLQFSDGRSMRAVIL